MIRIKTFDSLNRNGINYFQQQRQKICREFSSIDIQINDNTGIATVAMKSPPVNALSIKLIQEATDAFRDLNKNASRGIILTSAQPGVFSSGLDINQLIGPNRENFRNYWHSFQELCLSIYESFVPTAAAITGHAPAGGCCLALCCQYRVMLSGDYRIGLNETKFGIGIPSFLVELMRHPMSSREAERAVLAAELFTADKALKVGMIDDVGSDASTVIDKCDDFLLKCQKIDANARNETLKVCRRHIYGIMKNKEKGFDEISYFVFNPEVCEIIKKYKESLKKS